MLRHFCTFAHRTCRTNTRRQLRQCTDIPRDSFVQSSAKIRNYCKSNGTIIDEKSNNLPIVRTRLKTYWSTDTDSKTNNDNKNAETNDNTKLEKSERITAVPELLNDRKSKTLDEDIELRMPNALDKCTEDVSDVGSYTDPPRTFAYIADTSHAIQQLIKLGVKLYKLEKDNDIFRKVSQLNFDHHIKPKLQFLHDNGVEPANFSNVISNCPLILLLSPRVLESKIRYFQSNGFTDEQISMIITKKSDILALPIKTINERLRSIEQMFELKRKELTGLVAHQPKVIACDERKILSAVGHITNVLKFKKYHLKQLILRRPFVFIKNTGKMVDSCMYAMEEMGMCHEDLIKQNQILVCKKHRLESRHKFLVELKKAQYDPHLPGYIPPSKVVEGTDEEFCKEVANCNIDLYCAFLKTF